MKLKVSELSGHALDLVVAKTYGVIVRWDEDEESFIYHDREEDGERNWNPIKSWHLAGPIIEQEDISIAPVAQSEGWYARKVWGEQGEYTGQTPLIAAMRCYVASKRGEEVEIPDQMMAMFN